MVGGKVDECLKENSLDSNAVSKDYILPDLNVTAEPEYTSTTHDETSGILERVQPDCYREETSQKCIENDKGENLTPKRKSTVMDKFSGVTATLVDDGDHRNSIKRSCCNVVETSTSSKRIRRTSNVARPTSKSTDEKSCARNMEDSSRPQGNNVKDKKIRNQQKSLHLSLKPKLAKLCEILLLPDNVKSMVGKILEYIMNNYCICSEPVTALQAFQLSMCLTAASLLKHKLDTEDSLILAKERLNFECEKYVVDQMNAKFWDLREKFLLPEENSNVTSSPQAFDSSNRVDLNTYIMPYIESTETYVSRNIDESQKRKNQWRKLLQMQLENKKKLKQDIEIKEADFTKRYEIELGAYQKYYVMSKEKLEDYNAEYCKRLAELKRQHEVRLQALETKKLEARQKFRESWTLDEVLETSRECTTSSELGREKAVRLSNTVKSTDYQEKATDQLKSDAGLDRVICISSSDDEAEYQLKDNMVVNESTTSNHQEVVHKTMTENTLSPVTLSKPVNLIQPQEQVQLKPLSPPPSPVIILPNQSNHVSMVMEPIEKMQQLPSSSRFLSSNQDFSNEKKLASNLEVGSRKHQLVQSLRSGFNYLSYQKSGISGQVNNHPMQTDYLKMMLAGAKSNPEFPDASRMLHLQDAGFSHKLQQLPRHLQAGVEIRTPAPHLYATSTFIPCAVPHGMPSRPTKPSCIDSNLLLSGNLQAGGALHNQSYIGGVPHGMPSHHPVAPSNSPASYFSSSLSEWTREHRVVPPYSYSIFQGYAHESK
ncbi:hypothetical protein TSUD_187130 [Trifolium subterraneum]|uniref:MOM1 alpha-helical domain-containing protein n=1 Tax=Trifolium subterraneum TaxID=3900 RepID=A0A2Z6NB49_TRISU|nr:hypothetical protein TSUD_187130 [Trifolium subterraneum]